MKEASALFLEKKNPRTFGRWDWGAGQANARNATEAKFFCFFFFKKSSAC